MPVLANPRHERFAVEVAKGFSSTEAYKAAGYEAEGSSAWAAASRLLRDVRVKARIAELQERVATKAEITLETLIDHANEARSQAMEAGQFAAAVSAIKEMGVLTGLRVEKSERTNKSDARTLTERELDAAIADALAREEAKAGIPPVTH